MTKRLEYSSLEELRVDKRNAWLRLDKEVKSLQRDAVDCFLPSDSSYMSSDFSYMRYISYGVTAYKTFRFMRRAVGFVTKRRWK